MTDTKPAVNIVVDVETTGFQKNHVVTQFGALAIEAESRKFLSQGVFTIKITDQQIAEMSKGACDIQGWTKEANDKGVALADAVLQYKLWESQYNVLAFVAHNAVFDREFVVRQGFADDKATWCCTLQGFRFLALRDRLKPENHKLASLAKACGYVPSGAHNAMDDVLTCANGWVWLLYNKVPWTAMKLLYSPSSSRNI
jgi:DNA polymerase III epsilon subunit-like protein